MPEQGSLFVSIVLITNIFSQNKELCVDWTEKSGSPFVVTMWQSVEGEKASEKKIHEYKFFTKRHNYVGHLKVPCFTSLIVSTVYGQKPVPIL